MGKFITSNKDYILKDHDGGKVSALINKKLEQFNPDILGLGDINANSKPINSLCAVFDLAGFTNFCKQIDPQLAVPEFLHLFLEWIFNELKKELIEVKYDDSSVLYSELPFYTKFMGDGILLLWETNEMTDINICNVVVSLMEICNSYALDFLPLITEKIVTPPNKLRCGVARGIVYSIGDNNDFVGPCINMASRLEKLSNLTFCFSRRGIDYKERMSEANSTLFLVKKVEIRGIGNEELICILKDEYEKLSAEDKRIFKDLNHTK